jgi:hypothetical protein
MSMIASAQRFLTVGRDIARQSAPQEIGLRELAALCVIVRIQHVDAVQTLEILVHAGCVTLSDWKRNMNREDAAASDFALQADRAAHQVGEPARNRETESGPSETPGRRRLSLGEGLKDSLANVFGNANARVAHLESHVAASRRVAVNHHADTHFALLCELHRVRDEVEKDLPEAARIADERTR